ncbi:hypothetical protein GSI_11266 [Ganoderma sinense ZZ0214-1]|uniref:BTB domain-containing protein n=1 Tax=Ganoderma sinense ZZ0214-1 TaxID=1077348 RepID=A0A2G8RYP8_9APHY|nr:hypothetical protein GSI_11266 [Ganoderma sinense ZZ0214-1]
MQYSFPSTRPPSPPPYTESVPQGRGQGAHVPVPRRDPDFWFEDGNVVVIADSTSFRIHRSVLARHSDLLADRLGSDHDHRDETPDGCPVIRVADSARSFRGLLSLLYPGPSEILRHVASTSDNRVPARVTHKYLHALLPTTFDEWKRREDRALHGNPPPPPSPNLIPNRDMIGVLNALRQIHADDLLPIALYLCAQLPPRLLLPSSSPNPQRPNPQHPSPNGERLARADAERCLRLRESLVKSSARMAMRLFADAPSTDPRCRGCCRAVEEAFDAVVRGEFEDAPRTDPLGAFWRRYIDGHGHGGERGERRGRGDKDNGHTLRVCARCAGVLRERDEEQRRELWDELPRLVGF